MKKLLPLFYALCLSVTSYAQSGLVAHWNFNGTTNDVSGNGLNGTPSGTTFAPGYSGTSNTALYFSGYNAPTQTCSYVAVPYSPALNVTQFSLCMLVKPTDFYSGLCQGNRIFQHGNENAADHYMLELQDNMYDNSCHTYSPNNFYFVAGIGNTAPPPATEMYPQPAQTNTWYCLVASYDGDTVRMYKDGILLKSVPRPYALSSSMNGATIGRSFEFSPTFTTYPFPFTGYMDDLRLYNRPLTQEEANKYCDSVKSTQSVAAVVSKEEELLIYPNPTSGDVTIQMPQNRKNSSYTIQNSIGQQIGGVHFLSGEHTTLDLGGLPSGVYIVHFDMEQGTVSRKIIKR